MMAPKVSVIIPVYNTEKYLKECVDSLTGQTLEEIEIILVDDGSKEECARLCDEFAKKDGRVKVIHKVNEGQGIARNAGLMVATGEYIGFVDSDDYVDVKMYEALYLAAKQHDADVVMSGVTFVGGNTFSKSGDFEEKDYFQKETVFEKADMKKVLLGVVGAKPEDMDDSRYGVSVWKNIFRRETIINENIQFVSERKIISEDAIFCVDFMCVAKKAVGIPGPFYRYRRNDQSFSKAYRADRFEKILIFLEEIENRIKNTVTKSEYDLYLKRLIQGYARILCCQEIMYAYEQKNGFSQLRKRLGIICKNQLVADTLKGYPWYKLPKKQAIFAFAMRYRLYFLQKILVLARAR